MLTRAINEEYGRNKMNSLAGVMVKNEDLEGVDLKRKIF